MFLKRLETVGFKSFAERVTIDFVSGVTAVVGPNGSGKSNVIDAVRWVLGEQSAKSLRGQRMEDIIFQGSDTRSPLNFAEVTLVLNNQEKKLPIDYNEVSITRRVYRSGESDFLINQQSCRLKDIVDLFMDTGLGRESFSIIGQGKIDEILSSKAEERRVIFEEAAGVLKYKQRKNKAQFKLEETKENLNRVEDIIYEIEQQSEPLKEQADIAKKYKAKRAALKQVEIALLITEIEQLNTKWRALLKAVEEERMQEIKQKTVIQEREANVTQDQQRLHELDQDLTEIQQNLLSATERVEQYEGKRNVYYERLKYENENRVKLKNDRAIVDARMTETKQLLQTEKQTFSEVSETIQNLKETVKQMETEMTSGHEKLIADIDNLKSDYIEYLNEKAVLQNEEQSIARQLRQMEQTHTNEQENNESFLIERAEMISLKTAAESKIKEENTKVKSKTTDLAKWKANLLRERQNYESMQEKLYQGNEQIAKLTSRKELLAEMKETFQGFFYGVKAVLKANKAKKLQNIHGAVIDLIDVPNAYITAIDTVLGAQVQHIVVPNDAVARESILWLKQENKGRATFLPLQSIEPRDIPNQVLSKVKQHPGYIGIAAKLVKTEEEYRIVAHHLMGNVIVTKDLHAANEIAKLTNRRFRVVTLDGDIVFPGGSMSGGAKKNTNQSLFTREKELVTLQTKLTDYHKRAKEFTAEVEAQRKLLLAIDEEISDAESALSVLTQTLQGTMAQQNRLEVTLANLDDDLSSYDLHMKQYEEDVQRLKEQAQKVAASYLTVQEKINQTEMLIEEMTAEEKALVNEEKETQAKLHSLAINVAEQEQKKQSQQDKLATINEQLTRYQAEETELLEALKQIDELRRANENEAELNAQIEANTLQRDTLKETLDAKQSERRDMVQYIEDEEREIKQLVKLHEKSVQGIQANEVKSNRLDVALENRLSHLQAEYVITYERARIEYKAATDVERATEDVKRIKRDISQLGTVNLGAIEEYERIMERYTFLTEQQHDLEEAKATLYEAINEMDVEMIARFSEVFYDVQLAFTEVFQRLFDGGHAELKLTDPANLLETGIDIIAQPPGKKMKSLGLLSGGERALTAIALLFAILRVKPVPFCILDEVDAALDEANVKRFSNYLKHYSEGTQFIVITHRNGTMEEADVLYGVTMQESGVSRLVSVRLEEIDHLIQPIS